MNTTTGILLAVSLVATIALAIWMRFRWFLYCGNIRRDIPVTPMRFLASLYSLFFFIFMVYGLALPFTLVLYLTVWNKRHRLYAYHVFLRWSSQLILKMLPGIDYTFNNAVGERFDRPAVIISNHQGHFDLMCIMMMTPRLVVLTNQWVWRNPLYGWIIRLAEFYPVTNGLDYNIPKLKSLIDRGYSVVVFPEGTRSADCRILRFHTGAFYLADKLGVDVLPVILHGVGHCIPKKDFMLRPGHMYLEVMPRVNVKPDGSELYMRQLAKKVRASYIERFAQLKAERETAAYFTKYVIYKYSYISMCARRRVKRMLRENNNYSTVVNADFKPGSLIIIRDTSLGTLPWLLALVHESSNIYAIETDLEDLGIARQTPAKPENLKFSDNSISPDGNYLITMNPDGSVAEIKHINPNE